MISWFGIPLGCGPGVPLAEVAVVGGPASLAAEVHEELAAFDRATGEGRLLLREVRFTDALAPRGIGGMVRGQPPLILLDTSNGPGTVRRVLRHELCHALDFQEDLTENAPPWLDELATGIESDQPLDLGRGDDVDNWRSEAMAAFCELGPLVAQSLSAGDCDDPALAIDIHRWLLHRVWLGDLPTVYSRDEESIASWDARTEIDGQVLIQATLQPEVAQISLTSAIDAWDWREVWVDLYTGEEVNRSTAVDSPSAASQRRDLSWTGIYATSYAGSDDLGAAVGNIALRHLGSSDSRLFAFDEAWHAVVGCARAAEQPIMVDGDVWTGWVDGPRVMWGPLFLQ